MASASADNPQLPLDSSAVNPVFVNVRLDATHARRPRVDYGAEPCIMLVCTGESKPGRPGGPPAVIAILLHGARSGP
jgi:hypothetical protein